jgi:hypothetical protein
MSTQPKALRLADALDAEFVQGRISNSTGRESAVELRRLALKQWVGLTDDAVFELADTNLYDGGKNYGVLAFAKAIEQALREKNHGSNPDDIPLYTTPPKREWVGLTDDEIQDLGYLSEKFDASNSEWFDRWGFAQAIEAKLKGKNHE